MPRSGGGGGGGAGGGGGQPLKNHKNIGFPNITCPDPLKNHKAAKPTFNVGPSTVCQLIGVSPGADDGPLIVVSSSSVPPHQLQIYLSKLDPLWKNFLDPRMSYLYHKRLCSK